MERYIDANKTLDELDEFFDTNYWGNTPLIDGVVRIVNNQKPADVVPVVRAHWEIIYESSAGVTDARCSNCGYESLAYENDVHTDENCNYCPCCGAKMDEEVQ